MPLRSLKAILWRRLYHRFDILGSIMPGVTEVGEVIIPVTQADQLLKSIKGTKISPVLAAGETVRQALTTVPTGKRWTVYWMDVGRSAGDNNISRFEIKVGSLYYSFARQGTPDNAFDLNIKSPFPMDEGHVIYLVPDGSGVVETTFVVDIWLDEEDAY